MRAWRFLAPLLCLMSVVAACARPAARPPELPPASAAEVFAVMRRREETIRTLRARFSAVVHQGDTERRAEGVLLVKKPDRFRLRLLSPFGFTVFDYAVSATHATMELPLEGKRLRDDEIGTQSAFAPSDLRQAFLRGSAAFPGACTPTDSGTEVTVECVGDASTGRREIQIARATATVSRETSFDGDTPRLIITFTDYRVIGGLPLPFSIELRVPPRQVTMQITLRSYEVNPVLDDALFDATVP